jgi:hypothetical protein
MSVAYAHMFDFVGEDQEAGRYLGEGPDLPSCDARVVQAEAQRATATK